MDLLGVLRACLRRWYVFFPIVGATVWLCLDQYRSALPQYTATTSFVVVPSTDLLVARAQQSEGTVFLTTPFASGDAAGTLAGMLTNALNTETVRIQLLPAGGVTLEAVREPEVDDTLVTVTLVADDAATASAAVGAVQGATNGVLSTLQTDAGAPPTQLYAAAPGGPVDAPVEDYPDRIRGVVAIGLAGALVAVVLSVLAQSVMGSRRRRKERRPAAKASRAAKPPREPKQRRPKGGRRGGSSGSTREEPTVDVREAPTGALVR